MAGGAQATRFPKCANAACNSMKRFTRDRKIDNHKRRAKFVLESEFSARFIMISSLTHTHASGLAARQVFLGVEPGFPSNKGAHCGVRAWLGRTENSGGVVRGRVDEGKRSPGIFDANRGGFEMRRVLLGPFFLSHFIYCFPYRPY